MVAMATYPLPNFFWGESEQFSNQALIILRKELKNIMNVKKKCLKELDYTFH